MLTKTLFFVFFFIIFFPITLKVDFLYFSTDSLNDKKIYFSFFLYGFLKILSGYAIFEKKCIAIHVNNKRAILIYSSDLLDTGTKYKKLKNFEVYEIKSMIEIGNNASDEELGAVIILKNIVLQLEVLYKNKKDFAKLKNDFVINEQTEGVNIFLSAKVVFNCFVLLTALIKKILENFYAKKQTN